MRKFYVTREEAVALGFTHYGSYFRLPCYLKIEGKDLFVLEKYPLLGWMIPVIAVIENTIGLIIDPSGDQFIRIVVNGRI